MQSNSSEPMNAPDAMKPRMRPFLPATAHFAGGKNSPREFLERCIAQLDAWEPKIGAFVTLNLAGARAAADRSTEPLAGGQAAFADRRHADRNQGHHRNHRHAHGERFAPVRRLPWSARQRERRGAARGGRGDCRQDGDDRVRLDAAARDQESVGSDPHAWRLEQRFGRGGRRRRDQRRASAPKCSARSCGRRASAAASASSQQSARSIAAAAMTRFPRARTGRLPRACRRRGKSPTRSRGARAETPAFRDSTVRRPAPRRPHRAGLRFWKRTAGRWRRQRQSRRSREALAKLKSAGVTLVSRHENEKIAAVEDAIHGARELCANIIAWESRWPINTYRARDASKLSPPMLELGAKAEAMTLDDYRRDIRERDRRRAVYQDAGGGIRRLPDLGGAGRRAGRPRLDRGPGVRHSGVDARRSGDLASRPSGRRPSARASVARIRRRRRGAVFDRRRRAGFAAAGLTPPGDQALSSTNRRPLSEATSS